MRVIRFVQAVRFGAAIAGLATCLHVSAQSAPPAGNGKDTSQYSVTCDLLTNSLTCRDTKGSFTFSATMDQSVSTGTNGNGTMTFYSSPSSYKNIVCSIDLTPLTTKVQGDIWCSGKHAVLDQPTRNRQFGNRVGGQGSFR